MKIRDFWTYLIKILGLWFILSSLSYLSGYFSITLFYFQTEDFGSLAAGVVGLLIVALLYWLLLQLLFFRTDWIIDQLKLDKGYQEEKLHLDGQMPAIVNIAIIVTGGFLLINTLPVLFKELFDFFQKNTIFRESTSSGSLILLTIKVIIGYLLISNSNIITKYIMKQSSGIDNF